MGQEESADKHIITVTCAVIVSNDTVLVTQRGAMMSHPLLWEFPGGKLEKGESPEKGIYREIKEELGVEIRIREQLEESFYNYGTFQINLIPFLAEIISGTISPVEHSSIKWLKISELDQLSWVPADVAIVAFLMANGWDKK